MRKLITLLALFACIGLNGAEKSKIETAKGTVAPSERLEMPINYVRSDTDLKACVEAKKFQAFAFGRGNEKKYRSAWFEINENEVIFYDVFYDKKTKERYPKEINRYQHGLNLKKAKTVNARLDVVKETATLYIEDGKAQFETIVKGWFGGGEPFIKNLGTKSVKAGLSFERKTADQPVWIYGDSYLGSFSDQRWPYYMRKDGNDNWMQDHLPGGSSRHFVDVVKHDLQFGTPKYIIYTLQGNDKADKDVVDPTWLRNVEAFIALCKENNIEPILEVCPGRRHTKKGEWVKNSGYRYIDLFSICCNEDGSWKDPNWLSKDKKHPTKEGAIVMWEGIKGQFPDLFR